MDEAEASADYARRNTDERRIAFGHALAALCNQWSMSMNRGWMSVTAQRDGWETVANDKTDVDGDVTFTEAPREEKPDGQG